MTQTEWKSKMRKNAFPTNKQITYFFYAVWQHPWSRKHKGFVSENLEVGIIYLFI